MSYRVGTPNYNLPQTEGTDKRDWADTNQAFLAIDTAIKNAVDTSASASSAASTAQQTADGANTAAAAAQTAAGNAQTAASTAGELAQTAKNRADSAYTLANTANDKITWKNLGDVVGDTAVALPSDWSELHVTLYISQNQTLQGIITRQTATSADKSVVLSYYYTPTIYWSAFIVFTTSSIKAATVAGPEGLVNDKRFVVEYR